MIEARIRETTEYASVLFYIDDSDRRDVGTIFSLDQPAWATIPEFPDQRKYNAAMPDTGELRVGEFILRPFDVTMATPLSSVRESVMDGYVESLRRAHGGHARA